MAFRNAKVARLAAGAAIVSAAGITGAVAVAQTGPSGAHYGDETGQYGAGGNAYGHRLHCPSYRGMERSKGHATCHEAPRSDDDVKAGEQQDHDQDQAKQDQATAPEQDTRVMGSRVADQSTTPTERHSDLDDHATTTTTEVKALQATQPTATQDDPAHQNCDHDRTGANATSTTVTSSPSDSQTQAQQADGSDDQQRDAQTSGYHRDGDRRGGDHGDGGDGAGRH